MEQSEQKFFEDLAKFGGGGTPKPDVQIGFAKATTAAYKPAPRKQEKESLDTEAEGSLTIDVYQTANDIVVESAVAGVRPEDLDVEVSTDSVTIRGQRKREHEISDEDYYYQECYWGKFSRSVILPQEIDPDSAHVKYSKTGILTIRLPKLNRKKNKKLKVSFD